MELTSAGTRRPSSSAQSERNGIGLLRDTTGRSLFGGHGNGGPFLPISNGRRRSPSPDETWRRPFAFPARTQETRYLFGVGAGSTQPRDGF
jgi:hypothetical protein